MRVDELRRRYVLLQYLWRREHERPGDDSSAVSALWRSLTRVEDELFAEMDFEVARQVNAGLVPDVQLELEKSIYEYDRRIS